MRTTLQENVSFTEILTCLKVENSESESLLCATDYLTSANNEFGSSWTLVALSKEDILIIMLPEHRHPRTNPHPLIPEAWLAVSDAAVRVRERTQEAGECWDNINSHKSRDFSQTHIFLKWQGGFLKHLDGLHRLLAYVVFEKKQAVPAYVAGLRQEAQTDPKVESRH